jgi:hypothetical protein
LRVLDWSPRQGLLRELDRWREQCCQRLTRASQCCVRDRHFGWKLCLRWWRRERHLQRKLDLRFRQFGGDLKLGLIDSQLTGFSSEAGFESVEFVIEADGVKILDTTLRSLAVAEI